MPLCRATTVQLSEPRSKTSVGTRLGVRLHRGRLDVSVESVEKDDRNSEPSGGEGTD